MAAAEHLSDDPLHVDASLGETLVGRFEESHAIEIIKSRSRRHADPDELRFISRRQRRAALDEYRPGEMSWLWLKPNDGEGGIRTPERG